MIKPSPLSIPPALIKAHFVARGTSYAAWGRDRGFNKSMLCKLISGQYRGMHPVSKRMRAALEHELKKAS